MSHETALLLWAFLAFQLKHFLCDFVLQTEYQVRTKAIYGHLGGILHVAIHIVGTIPALLILGAGAQTIAIILIAEAVIHYHVDWTKSFVDRTFKWGVTDHAYWILFGADQLAHQLTYIGIVTVLAAGGLQ